MKSAIYTGWVRHRRYTPVENAFTYKLYMMYIDLSELPQLFDGHWLWSARGPALAWFRREDHMRHSKAPVDEAVRDLVEEKSGTRPTGPIRMLTHLRYFGHCFNPVSFYYCFDAADTHVETIVAEVHNTPWLEQHCYVLDQTRNEAKGAARHRHRFHKDFHVSPFIEMEIDYDWRFTDPAGRLLVHMENFRDGKPVFDATMNLEKRPITGANLASVLLFFPAMTMRVVALIYWQALKLWWKGARFYTHPKKLDPTGESRA